MARRSSFSSNTGSKSFNGLLTRRRFLVGAGGAVAAATLPIMGSAFSSESSVDLPSSKLLVRRNVTQLSSSEKHELVNAILAMKKAPSPLFFLHHAFVDKIWADWMVRHGHQYLPLEAISKPVGGVVPIRGKDTPIKPFDKIVSNFSTPASVLDHHQLGYRYDTEQVAG